MITKVLSAATAFALTASVGSAATFNGDTAQFQFGVPGNAPIFDTPAVIGSGPEFELGTNLILDIEDLNLAITYDLGGSSEVGADTLWRILDLDADDGSFISNVTLTGGNSRLVSDISFTRDSIDIEFINFTSAQSPGSQTWTFEITTAAVPLPASLPLMLLGFGVLGAAHRRRKTA